MLYKNLFMSAIVQFFLFYSITASLSAEELSNKEVSLSPIVKSTSSNSIQIKRYNRYDLSNHVDAFLFNSLSWDTKASYKSPWVAFLLSYIIPGAGQIYNGEIIKGLVFTGTFVLGAAIALIPAIGATSGSDWPVSSYIGAGIAGIAYFWQLIDAPISASRINEENKQLSFFNVIVFDDHQVNVGLSAGLIKDVLSIGLKINYKVPIF